MLSARKCRERCRFCTVWFVAALVLAVLPSPARAQTIQGKSDSEGVSLEAKVRFLESYGRLPLSFEANRGQTDRRVDFLARGKGYSLFLTSTEAVMSIPSRERLPRAQSRGKGAVTNAAQSFLAPVHEKAPTKPDTILRMKLVGANPTPTVTGLDELPGKSNYFIGNDPSKWRTNVPTYAKVRYENVYSGIDLVYYGNQRQLEYDFVVAPGADPGAIRLAFPSRDEPGSPAHSDALGWRDGAVPLRIDAQGDLVLETEGSELRLHQPVIYQEISGARQRIGGNFVIFDATAKEGGREVGFEVARYDASKPLIIDPVLSYSTYLGGSEQDYGYGIAMDSSGNAYVTGLTYSTNFPTANAFQAAISGSLDTFVTKLDATGSALVYSTYLGGSGDDSASDIAVDSSGNAYVTGTTYSTNFPRANAFQATFGGSIDAFVTKLNATGSALVYSTYLGGSGGDNGNGIALDSSGNAYVTGLTLSPNFPTANALQAARGGDAFVTKCPANPTYYYFPHLALGGGWQTTITYINYSPQTVTCETTFLSDSGGPLAVSFGGAAASSRTDTLAPGGTIHEESTADLNAPAVGGWARAQCSGPIKTSLLFRFYQQGVATGEAGVNAMTAPATKFVTFAEQKTGVAYANPSTQPAAITFTALSSTGVNLASKSLTLLPGEHGAANLGPLLGLSSFTGSIQIVSTVPIVSLSLNAEAFPAFSSLPPGELDGSTASYFPHLALGGGWQTTMTYINSSSQAVTCETTFFSDTGGPLSVSFGGAAASSRTDTLAPGGVIHQETNAALNAAAVGGWARAQCSGLIKTSLLYRFYQQGVATGEAGVNAMTAPATKFVTFSDQTTGVAYANPSTQTAEVTFTAISSAGAKLASKSLPLLAGEHGAANLGPLLGLSSFTGSIQIVSTVPIVSLSLNAEAFPAFSSLPPGELDDATPLATGN